MVLHRLTREKLEALGRISFEVEGIREHTDLQRVIRDETNVLEEGI
jgi:hypothetical protein